ncbi:MAG: MOSC domain-containing protein, partial [Chitinophagaceae bacterium]|nr:MOSC domain-containing protein [Chitinophagaceae bacterium]
MYLASSIIAMQDQPNLKVSQLFIYPIKSLGGISVSQALLQERGFQYDRRWMLVDSNNQFLTQRVHPNMASLRTSIVKDEIHIINKNTPYEKLIIPATLTAGRKIRVQVWADNCEAIEAPPAMNDWFSKQLGLNCKLVHMPVETKRLVDENYAIADEITSFADAYPVLIIGQSSLDDLNDRLAEPLPINRFRPNIVFEGGRPYEEDEFASFEIKDITFYGVKLCSRCVLTTVDQETSAKGKEPLRTLASYRHRNNQIY